LEIAVNIPVYFIVKRHRGAYYIHTLFAKIAAQFNDAVSVFDSVGKIMPQVAVVNFAHRIAVNKGGGGVL